MTVVEPDSGRVPAAFTVTLDNQVDVPVTVAFATTDGTSEDESGSGDYQFNSGQVSFPAGSAEGAIQTISILVDSDDVAEPDEHFFVTLSNILAFGCNVAFASHRGEATIQNDDFAPVADAGGPYVTREGDSLHLDALSTADADSASLIFRWDVDGDFDENIATATPTVTWDQLAAFDLPINDGPDGPRTRVR